MGVFDSRSRQEPAYCLERERLSQVASWDEFYQTRHLRRKPLVVAHRGAPNVLPENTLASFALALEQGADVLETDLRFTKDGEIVLFHDATLERMTEGAGPLRDHTLAEIKGLRTWAPQRRLSAQRPPALIELLEMTQARTPLLLELKDPLFADEEYARKLVDVLVAYQVVERCALVSFKPELVQAVKRLLPAIPTGHITLNNLLPIPNTELLGPFWPLLFANPFYVAAAHRMGGIVAPLDTTPERRMRYYLQLGVDAVLADDPAGAIAAMGGKA